MPKSRPASYRYRGDFVAWEGGCVLIGAGGGSIAPHAHYAIQLVLGAPGGLRVQVGRQGPWHECAGAIVPSRAVHSIDVTACSWSAVVFVEPETLEGLALSFALQGRAALLEQQDVAEVAAALAHAWQHDRRADRVALACRSWVRALAQTAPARLADPRVTAAIAFVQQRLEQRITLAAVARAVHLSPSRFRHLFAAETGMPLRSYLLWRRLLRVWSLLMQGESLSAAAHAAGFADSAHLSRTSRAMFGMPPSAMQMAGPLSETGMAVPAETASTAPPATARPFLVLPVQAPAAGPGRSG